MKRPSDQITRMTKNNAQTVKKDMKNTWQLNMAKEK